MLSENYLHNFKTNHIFHMTDDTGMLQHSIYGVPQLSEGYTSDDNARALIMAVMLFEKTKEKKVESLIYKYTSFLCYAQNSNGTFRNFMGYNREFLEKEGSEDCFGRCLWALCYAYSNPSTPRNIKITVWALIENALQNCTKLTYPRAKAYAIIGLRYLNTKKTNGLIAELASSLAKQYDKFKEDEWHWFEDSMAYCNSVFPLAMLNSYEATKDDLYKHIGYESLGFLESKTFRNGYFKPIGCKGWLSKGKAAAEFDEQPVEACEMTLAYLKAYKLSGKYIFLGKARTCFSWYRGLNSKNLSLVDTETGGCYDGITANGLNLNQGAESVVSFWIAYLEIEKYSGEKKQKTLIKTVSLR